MFRSFWACLTKSLNLSCEQRRAQLAALLAHTVHWIDITTGDPLTMYCTDDGQEIAEYVKCDRCGREVLDSHIWHKQNPHPKYDYWFREGEHIICLGCEPHPGCWPFFELHTHIEFYSEKQIAEMKAEAENHPCCVADLLKTLPEAYKD